MKQPIVSLCLFGAFLASTSIAEDWPHWLGRKRNGVTTETSAFDHNSKSWLPGPPLWKQAVGEGASSPIVVGGMVYAVGWENKKNVLRAIDAATGVLKWKQSQAGPRYGRWAVGDQSMYSGATATPEFDPATGLIYLLSCDGELSACDTRKSGKILWSLNLYEKYGIGRRPQITKRRNTRRDYGYTCAPLVYGDWVIVEAGDPKTGNLHAFDKRSGKSLWTSENRDVAGHSGGISLITVEGVPCAAVATSYHVLVIRLDAANVGKTVAEFPWATDFSNTISGVSVRGNELLVSSRYNHMAMVKVAVSLKNGAHQIWKNSLPSGVCAPVIYQSYIYFANRGVHCVDFQTGKSVWEGGRVGDAGSCLVTSDDRLVVWANNGDLSLVETAGRSPGKYALLARKDSILHGLAWPHVVLSGGRIFCKTSDGSLVCFSLP